MARRLDTVVIGAGQAGLAAGYYLRQCGASFVILDGAAKVGDSWRRRWDSLRLFTPAKYNALPGRPFPGDPRALPHRDEVAKYLTDYAEAFDLPLEMRTSVTGLDRENEGYRLQTTGGEFEASSVIVATGAYQRPRVPGFAEELSPAIRQLHSDAYQNPAALPPGDVLVVGAGNSGAQIALELSATRQVTLSGPSTGSLPRRLLGRDVYDWLWPTLMRASRDSRLGRHLMAHRAFSGDPLIGMSARDLERSTLTRAGRTVGVVDGCPVLDDGRVLRDVRTVVFGTGYRPDFSWIHLPVFEASGYPAHHRGLVADAPGLAFLGLRYQYRLGSSLLGGVGEDAAFVVQALAPHGRILAA